jgi:hypothetical protein
MRGPYNVKNNKTLREGVIKKSFKKSRETEEMKNGWQVDALSAETQWNGNTRK